MKNGDETTESYDSTLGYAMGLFIRMNLTNDGYNKLTFQYGKGTGSDFSPNVQDPSATLYDAWRFRFTESSVDKPL